VPTMNSIVAALRFFFTHTLDRPDHAQKLAHESLVFAEVGELAEQLIAPVGRAIGSLDSGDARKCLDHLAGRNLLADDRYAFPAYRSRLSNISRTAGPAAVIGSTNGARKSSGRYIGNISVSPSMRGG
jgi:hypothetical protein